MSVLVEFSIFPTDKGESVSEYVSKVIEYIKNTKIPFQLTSMGTIIETEEMETALNLINQAYIILSKYSSRIHIAAKFDIRTGKINRIKDKINSIEDKIGKI
jgi:uncharacterized protein (TIGR00106 family)